MSDPGVTLSRQPMKFAAGFPCQGPWNVDLRTPPGPEGSNGSLLRICRGHPDTFSIASRTNFIGAGDSEEKEHDYKRAEMGYIRPQSVTANDCDCGKQGTQRA